MRKQYGTFYSHNARDIPGEYFPMPKSIFRLGLTAGEILVYTYLMYCEDRKTFQCHPSYATIGEAVNMSNNTVAKHVEGACAQGADYHRAHDRENAGRAHAQRKPALYALPACTGGAGIF